MSRLNLIGQRFGKLTVTEYSHYKNSRSFWKCKCDCGNEKIAQGVLLKKGETASCGCIRKEILRSKKRPYEWIYDTLVYQLSKRKNINRSVMTFEEFLKFTSINKCHYCGTEIIWPKHREYTGTNFKPVSKKYNLDRKDNAKGYTTDNCVVCCSLCNHVKNWMLSYDEMRIVGESIAEIHKKRAAENNAL